VFDDLCRGHDTGETFPRAMFPRVVQEFEAIRDDPEKFNAFCSGVA